MPNRSEPPPIAPIYTIPFPDHTDQKLNGLIPLVHLQSDNFEVVKIEFVFRAGRMYEKKRMVSKATNMMLKSGTASKTSKEINEQIEFYGGTISLPINFDYGAVVLYCLSQYVKELLPLVMEIMVHPTYPQEELDFYKEQQKSKLNLAMDNVDTVAFRAITEELFGKDHPYGYNSEASDYDALTREDLLEHHHRLYSATNCKVFISGNLLAEDRALIEESAKLLPKKDPIASNIFPAKVHAQGKQIRIEKDDKVQVAIRIGRRTFTRQHEDFQELYLFGVLLGGYFGSRLSMKIREEKGYTYGIHSTLDAMVHDGCFLISTEVAKEYAELTLEAIYAEIKDMRDHVIGEDELLQMKSYLQGYLLNSVDGVFRSATVLKGLRESGVGVGYFESLQEALKKVTSESMQRIAQKYFQKEDLWEVVVG